MINLDINSMNSFSYESIKLEKKFDRNNYEREVMRQLKLIHLEITLQLFKFETFNLLKPVYRYFDDYNYSNDDYIITMESVLNGLDSWFENTCENTITNIMTVINKKELTDELLDDIQISIEYMLNKTRRLKDKDMDLSICERIINWVQTSPFKIKRYLKLEKLMDRDTKNNKLFCSSNDEVLTILLEDNYKENSLNVEDPYVKVRVSSFAA